MTTIRLNLSGPDRSHDVVVERGSLRRLLKEMRQVGDFSRIGLVTDDVVRRHVAEPLQTELRGRGMEAVLFSFPAGEKTKSMETVLDLCLRLLANGFDRHSVLLAVGGGVVGDITGFAAAIYLRGIRYIQVPTTLLAQVDSAIGGKTGVDLRSGKNLIGSFHQPLLVLIDPDVLATLPREAMLEGFAEVIKVALVADPILLKLVEDHGADLLDPLHRELEEVILRACQAKCRVVSQDEQEAGLRRILNFGHTVGHALEAASGYTLSHGRAVAVGMGAAIRCSERWTGLERGQATRVLEIMERLGLSTKIPVEVELEAVLASLERDKKIEGEVCHFVFLGKIGTPVVKAIPIRELRMELEEILREMV
ncbi:MAG TPA: 3-dehydroquinate synthase [Syntrophobacteria bacterium]|nr:3-dehydroquinate synthase [Syntrophobacteria bacterium]